MDWQVGDKVLLKSGGPPMTVNAVEAAIRGEGQFVAVVWFGGDNSLKTATFHSETLMGEHDAEPRRRPSNSGLRGLV